MLWDREKVLKFIELYRNKKILWNPKHKHYFNKVLKNDAWTEICAEMGCGATVQDLKKKMENLLGQLRREKGKTKKTTIEQGEDEAYQSTWYAYEHMRFLFDRKKRHTRKVVSTSDTEDLQGEEGNDYSNVATTSSENEVPIVKNELYISTENEFSAPYVQASKRKRYNSNDSETEIVNSALEMPSSASATKEVAARASDSDEIQMYANFIASKMRTYSQRTKNSLQHQISNLLFRADNGYYDQVQSIRRHVDIHHVDIQDSLRSTSVPSPTSS